MEISNNTSLYIHLRGIDLTKLLMAFSVIAIHSPEYLWPDNRSYQMGIDWFIRLAVPFFFIASGFAVQKKLNLLAKEEDIRNYLSVRSAKLWRVWAIWLLIYLPLSLWAIYPVALPWSEKFYCYVKDVFMTGSSEYAHHLWFVYSLAIFTSPVSYTHLTLPTNSRV